VFSYTFPNTLGGISFEKLGTFYEGEEPFFSIKRVPLPHTPSLPKRTTKGLAALWTLAMATYFSCLGF